MVRAENPSVFSLESSADPTFDSDEDDEVHDALTSDKEDPEMAYPFGMQPGSVGDTQPAGSARDTRGDDEGAGTNRDGCCNCDYHRPSSGAQDGKSGLQEAIDTIMAASAATDFQPFRSVRGYQARTGELFKHDLSPFYHRLSRRRLLHRTAATAGGGDMVSTYVDDDGFEYAIVDSGASGHFVGDTVKLENTRPANLWMTSANGSKTRINTQGDLTLQAEDEHGNPLEPIVLSDVSHCRGSPLNLISVAMLCEEGTAFHFEKGKSYMQYGGKRFPLIEKDGLYLLRLNDVLQAEDMEVFQAYEAAHGKEGGPCYRTKSGQLLGCAATYDLWHERFGHASKQRIKFLYENGTAQGLDVGGEFKHNAKCKCSVCLMSNTSKIHIGDTREFSDEVSRKGELLLSDLSGPFPPSIEGYRYVISFTDTLTRFSACYMLKRKSDAVRALRAVIRFYADNGVIISRIRTDQGGEFGGHHERTSDSGENGRLGDDSRPAMPDGFAEVCKEHGIKHELTPARRPELHGLAERWNKTVLTMANSMLFAARISHILWPAAVAHGNMLRNRLPIRGLGKFSPYELFFGRRPNVSNLKIWGCDCYKLLPTYPKVPGQSARKRLLYVGETADRIGFRCLDPGSLKYTTEFELIFDEYSALKRVDQLKQHDIRRELMKKGKLHEYPLLADDFADSSLHYERSAFSSPDVPSHVLKFQGSEGASGIQPVQPPGDDEEHLIGDHRGDGSASRGGPGYVGQPHATSDLPHRATSDSRDRPAAGGTALNRTTDESRPKTSTSRFRESVTSSDQTSPLAPRMGDRPAPNKQRSQGSTLGSTAASPVLEEDEDDTRSTEIRGTRGSSLQPGRTQVVCDSSSSTLGTVGASVEDEDSPLSHLTEEDVVDAALHNQEAEAYGPLTEAALRHERARSRLDPRHPRRPLRYLKVGEIEPDTEQFKTFRKFALENDFPIRLVPNPKDPKSESWKRYEKYSMAHKLRDVIELSVTAKDEATRRKQRSTALKDITFDALRGYIQWPQHEHNASRHYVNAAWLAKEHRTVNIHALYSKAEMDTARKQAVDEEAAKLATDIAEGERLAAEREKRGLPMSTFHEVIKSLWDYDPSLQLNDDAVAREAALAATLIADLIAGDIPEPLGYRQATAANHPERKMWIESMERERATLEKMGTWVMVPRSNVPRGHRPIKCKFVYRKKLLKDGSLSFKSRLVGCGYSQRAGVDFSTDELYAGVASYSSFRFLMSLACQKNYILVQSDIQAAYLQADLSEQIWMEAPPDMWVDGKPPRDKDGNELCCLLKKSLTVSNRLDTTGLNVSKHS